MNSPETIISTFIEFLARVRAMFREVHLFAEMDPRLHSVTTAVIPFKTEPSDYADDGLTIAVALNAELVKWEDRNRKAIGMSLLLRRSGGMWCAEAEVGWSGESIGWDPFDFRELQEPFIDGIIQQVPPLIDWMALRFRGEVEKLPALEDRGGNPIT